MKISYAITVCDELEEIKCLLDFLIQNKREKDEIVVLLDNSNSTKEVESLLHLYRNNKHIILYVDYFEGHFANWKNKLTQLCSGDYIFQIDADEMIDEYLINTLPYILKNNLSADIFWVPRINIVHGLTQNHIMKWGWRTDKLDRVNFPDYQCRIYKNSPNIKWKNKVHEVLEGYKIENRTSRKTKRIL